MSKERETGRLVLGKGCLMKFIIEDSQPPDSLYSHWSEVHYDGAEGSDVPAIPAHWHKYHDEHMQVTQGRIEFTVDGKIIVAKAGDDMLTIPRLHTHGFRFFKGEAGALREYTTPPGDFKEVFFENLLDTGSMTLTSALRAAYYGDTFFALPGNFKLLEQTVTIGFGGMVAWLWPQRNKGLLGESAVKADATARA